MRMWITYVCSLSWMCNKQTAVSHSSAESEIISLDAGLRTDDLPTFQFGDCALETLSSKQAKGTLSVAHAKESFSLNSHSDILCF